MIVLRCELLFLRLEDAENFAGTLFRARQGSCVHGSKHDFFRREPDATTTKKERSEWDNSLLPGQDLRQLR